MESNELKQNEGNSIYFCFTIFNSIYTSCNYLVVYFI